MQITPSPYLRPWTIRPATRRRQVLDNIPIDVAREKGADIVIALDISENMVNYNITNLVDVMFQAVNIMFSENVKFKEKEADVSSHRPWATWPC